MSNVTLDELYGAMMSRASAPFRRICEAVQEELQHGDPAKAYALVDELIRTKPMGPVDRRCMLSLRVALRAVGRLRAAGLPRTVGLQHHIGFFAPSINGLAIERRYIAALQSALSAEVDARTATPAPCPNCGSVGPEVGWTKLVRDGAVPNARFYIDPDRAVADAMPDHFLDPERAHLVVNYLLDALGARAPVRACGSCRLRYISWHREDAVEEHYLAPPFRGFDLHGEDTFGRAHVLSHTYWKAALPLHIEKVLGSVQGLSVYEFGCGEGVMLSLLADLGAHARGSDLDQPKIRYGRHVLGLTGLSDDGDYFWSMPERSVDCLYASHSVEHVLPADRLFDRFSRTVKPGGHLVVGVPCTSVRPSGEVSQMGADHLIGYDRPILTGFFQRHGFEIVDCRVDDGELPADRLDPLLLLPDWSGQPAGITVVGRRRAA